MALQPPYSHQCRRCGAPVGCGSLLLCSRSVARARLLSRAAALQSHRGPGPPLSVPGRLSSCRRRGEGGRTGQRWPAPALAASSRARRTLVGQRWATRRAGPQEGRRSSARCPSGGRSQRNSGAASLRCHSIRLCRFTTGSACWLAWQSPCCLRSLETTPACCLPSWCCWGRGSSGACWHQPAALLQVHMRMQLHSCACARVHQLCISLVLNTRAALRRYLLINPPDRVELYENRVVVRLKFGSKFLVGGCLHTSQPLSQPACCHLTYRPRLSRVG